MVEVELTVIGDDTVATVRSLEAWLAGREELRGRVRPVVAVPEPGAMGSVVDVLTVALGQGGMATATASVLISWIRRQHGKVSVTAKRPDGAEITLAADHVRGLTSEEIPALVTELAAALERGVAAEEDIGDTSGLDGCNDGK